MRIGSDYFVNYIQRTQGAGAARETSAIRTMPENVVSFDKAMRAALKPVMPTVSVDSIDAVDFKGITDYLAHRQHIRETVPARMNEMAKGFGNRTAFYDAGGKAGSYEYHTLELEA